MSSDNNWIFNRSIKPKAKKRIFFFNHAAGTTTLYKDYEDAFPDEYEICLVQYPMRSNRIGEKMPGSIEELVADFLAVSIDLFDLPFILFGHSMGAQVAYELAFQLSKLGKSPELLCISACEAPDGQDNNIAGCQLALSMKEEELIQILRDYDHMIDETILEDRNFLDYYLPIVRADFNISDSYIKEPNLSLTCKLYVFIAGADKHVDREKCKSWINYSRGKTLFYELSGDHFYLDADENRNKLISYICGGD